MARKRTTTSAVEILHHLYFKNDLEMTDYENSAIGDAMLTLQRIPKVTGKQIEFRVVPSKSEILVASDYGLKEG